MSGGDFAQLDFWISTAQIFLVNVALSVDNAVVIAMAARRVPADYRSRAVLWGGVAAIVLRVFFTLTAAYLMHLPGLMLAGGVLLFYVSCKLLREEPEPEWSKDEATRSVLTAVGMIFLADLTMSLDNVLAVAGASNGHWVQMMIGMFTSIAVIILCSRYIAGLMNRFAWVVYAGAAILAVTAAQMILSVEVVAQVVDAHNLRFPIYFCSIGLCLATGLVTRERISAVGARLVNALPARRQVNEAHATSDERTPAGRLVTTDGTTVNRSS